MPSIFSFAAAYSARVTVLAPSARSVRPAAIRLRTLAMFSSASSRLISPFATISSMASRRAPIASREALLSSFALGAICVRSSPSLEVISSSLSHPEATASRICVAMRPYSSRVIVSLAALLTQPAPRVVSPIETRSRAMAPEKKERLPRRVALLFVLVSRILEMRFMREPPLAARRVFGVASWKDSSFVSASARCLRSLFERIERSSQQCSRSRRISLEIHQVKG